MISLLFVLYRKAIFLVWVSLFSIGKSLEQIFLELWTDFSGHVEKP